jgi:transglutaminase-like putative cysteine protease
MSAPAFPRRLAMTAVLLIEASIADAVSGSGVYQAFLLSAAAVFFAVWWIARAWAGATGAVLAVLMGAGAWILFARGQAQVVLSDLPAVFHPAVAVHFWVWARLMARPEGRLPDGLAVAAVCAGGAIVWAVAISEIYGSSILIVRALAAGTLLIPAAVVWHDGAPVARAVLATSQNSRQRLSPWRSAGLTLAALGLFALVAAWSQEPADRLAARLFEWAESRRQTEVWDVGNNEVPTFETGHGLGDGAMRELPRRADIHQDDTMKFWVQFAGSAEYRHATRRPLYLRSSAMAIFAGDGRIGPRRQSAWIYDSDDGADDGVTHLDPAFPTPAGDAIQYSTLIDRESTTAVPVMDGARSLGLDGIYAFADGWYQLALGEKQERVRFRGTAMPVRWEDLRDDAGVEPGEAPAEYRQLPRTALADRVAALGAESIPATGSWHRRIAAVRTLLRERCQYSLTFSNPKNLEPIENFLFAERRGHCELYAASAVLLLRSIGVPSRVAFGYAGGIADPARGLIAFRQSDSHAWVEILVKDHGWVLFDPTPPGSGAARPPLPNPKAAALAAFDAATYVDLGDGAIGLEAVGSRLARWLGHAVEWVSAHFVALSAGLGALFLVVARRRRSKDAAVFSDGADSGSVSDLAGDFGAIGKSARGPNLLGSYLAACAGRGHRKAPGQTLAEFQSAAKAADAAMAPFDSLVAYVYRMRYAGAPRDAEAEAGFEGQIRAITTMSQSTTNERE